MNKLRNCGTENLSARLGPVTEKNINGEVTMNDPFQDVDKAGLEFAENTAKTMEIRQSEPIMEKIVHDYLTELEFVSEKPTIEIGCGPGAISRRIAKHASRTQIIGFDPSSNYIDIARQGSSDLKNVEY